MSMHRMQQVGTGLERVQGAPGRLIEHAVGDVVEQMTFELEINQKVDVSLIFDGRENPSVG